MEWAQLLALAPQAAGLIAIAAAADAWRKRGNDSLVQQLEGLRASIAQMEAGYKTLNGIHADAVAALQAEAGRLKERVRELEPLAGRVHELEEIAKQVPQLREERRVADERAEEATRRAEEATRRAEESAKRAEAAEKLAEEATKREAVTQARLAELEREVALLKSDVKTMGHGNGEAA